MQVLTAEIFYLMVILLDGVQNELSPYGEHVCMRTENYEERTPVKRLKPRPVIKKKWCWSVTSFFSCERTELVWEEHVEYVVVPRSKLVTTCCDGYKKGEGRKCVPHCSHGCYRGECLAPDICDCQSGFHGLNCGKKCPDEYWGKNCLFKCECANDGVCYPRTGCLCQSGWVGQRCELPCQAGFYGHRCLKRCNCNEQNCNHITGECINTTTELTTTSFIEVTTAFTTTERDETSTGDSDQSLSTSTAHTAIETSTEVHRTTESSTTNDVSATEIIEDNDGIFDIAQTTTEATEKKDAVTTEIVSVKGINLTDVYELQSTKELVSTTAATEIRIFRDEITTSRAEDEEEINSVINETDDQEMKNNGEVKPSTIFSPTTAIEPIIGKYNKTGLISHTAKKEDADKNKTDNFISQGKENSSKETLFKFHFLPSLCLISAASFLIVIIAARWLIVNHRRKTRILVVVASEKGNIFQSEDGVKFQAENLFWVNNCTVNPVYTSDVDLNSPVPVLETFKPVDKGVAMKERTIL